MPDHRRITIIEDSQVGEARRAAGDLARALGFDEEHAGRAAIVVTEAATNLLKHAGRGEILLGAREQDGVRCLELLALDRGHGMDVAQASLDGFSTAENSRGEGLGAILRLSATADIFSEPGVGTVLYAVLAPSHRYSYTKGQYAGLSVAFPGEAVCGDAWAVSGNRCMMADGLGHGAGAADASGEAVAVFLETLGLPLGETLERMHLALKKACGAAVALAELHPQERKVTFIGVGNVAAQIFSGGPAVHLVSMNGTVGAAVHRMQVFTYTWPAGATLLLHSDGLVSRWNLEDHAGVLTHHPAVTAGLMYRDFRRTTADDVSVVVVKDT